MNTILGFVFEAATPEQIKSQIVSELKRQANVARQEAGTKNYQRDKRDAQTRAAALDVFGEFLRNSRVETRKPTLAIIVEGGLVQSVVCDRPNDANVEVIVIDYDVQDDADRLTKVPVILSDEVNEAYVHGEAIDAAAIDLGAVMKQLNGEKV